MFKILFGKDLQKEIKRKKTPANPLGLIPFPGPAPLPPPFLFFFPALRPSNPAQAARSPLPSFSLQLADTRGPQVSDSSLLPPDAEFDWDSKSIPVSSGSLANPRAMPL